MAIPRVVYKADRVGAEHLTGPDRPDRQALRMTMMRMDDGNGGTGQR